VGGLDDLDRDVHPGAVEYGDIPVRERVVEVFEESAGRTGDDEDPVGFDRVEPCGEACIGVVREQYVLLVHRRLHEAGSAATIRGPRPWFPAGRRTRSVAACGPP
jgi:hypothetical protein